MNSFNHYAYGAIGEWMVRVVAGLETAEQEPGYKHVLVQPQPGGGLTSAEARLQTLYGEAASGWALADARRPSRRPCRRTRAARSACPPATLAGVTEGGLAVASAPGVKAAAQEKDDVVVEVGSGSYRFAYDGCRSRRPDEPARPVQHPDDGRGAAREPGGAGSPRPAPARLHDGPARPAGAPDEPPGDRTLRGGHLHRGDAETLDDDLGAIPD